MKHLISSAEDLGLALRAARKSARVRLDDLSQTVGVSKQTTTNLEQGKPTVQLGTVLKLLAEMGLTLSVDLPESALPALRKAQAQAQDRRRGTAGSRAQETPGTQGAPEAARASDRVA